MLNYKGLLAIVAAAVMTAAPVMAASDIAPYRAHYEITRGGSNYGEAKRELRQDDDEAYTLYTITDISWLFLSDTREHTTRFLAEDTQMKPLSFAYKRTGTGSDKAFSAKFDREQTQVRNADNGEALPIEWSEDLLDEGSMIQQLQADLLNREQDRFEYRLVDEKGQEDEQTFQVKEEVVLELPYGDVKALEVARIRENSDRETLYWFAPEHNYLLVKMTQIEEGDEVATLLLKTLD